MVFEPRSIEGKLEKIFKVETRRFAGRIHPTIATSFTMYVKKGKRNLQFRGVILPDSIGNSIVVNIGTEDSPDIITDIYDKTLDRKYSTYINS